MVERLIGNKVIGIKQAAKAIKSGEGKILYVAKNADTKLIDPIISLANENSIEVLYIETTKELGRLCGIEVGSAAALLL